MEAVIGLLLIVVGVSHGVETSCDGRQHGSQCYGALGGTVLLRLVDSTSDIFKYDWIKNLTLILRGRKDKILGNQIANRSSFTHSNGTFRINNLSRTDGGEYTFKSFEQSGKALEPRTLLLTIQAPVSSVLLVSECLSEGEMRVSCSSEGGDSPQYSWTLDGHTLTDAQLLSGNKESNNIILKQNTEGQLVCSVSNNVSRVSGNETIPSCGFTFIDCIVNGTRISKWVLAENNTLCIQSTTASASTTEGKESGFTVSNTSSTNNTSLDHNTQGLLRDQHWYIMAGVLATLLILLVVGVAVVCNHKKKKSNKSKAEDDEQELTYADVRIVQRQGRPLQQRSETEVEYGQVKFSDRPQQTPEPVADDCVYAKVRGRR